MPALRVFSFLLRQPRSLAPIIPGRCLFAVSGRGGQRRHDQERAAPSPGKARNTLLQVSWGRHTRFLSTRPTAELVIFEPP